MTFIGHVFPKLRTPNDAKRKNFFWIFVCIFKIYIKFWSFSKTYDSDSLCISEITDSGKRGYINV